MGKLFHTLITQTVRENSREPFTYTRGMITSKSQYKQLKKSGRLLPLKAMKKLKHTYPQTNKLPRNVSVVQGLTTGEVKKEGKI